MTTKVLNIDDLVSQPKVRITVAGKSHDMKAATVEMYLENIKELQALELEAGPEEEVKVAMNIIARAFPTVKKDDIMTWPVEAINQLSVMVREVGGEVATDDKDEADEAKASGNAPAAD